MVRSLDVILLLVLTLLEMDGVFYHETYDPLIYFIFFLLIKNKFYTNFSEKFTTNKLGSLLGQSLSAPTIFFLITNFGVWTGSSMYSQDINGLIQCYFLALPFYASSLLATVLFASLFYFSRIFFIHRTLSNKI